MKPDRLFVCLAAVSILTMATMIAAGTPQFSKDAQYYLQAGPLWADGKVSYAANLIGSRVFAVMYYYLFQNIGGASVDSVSLALACAYLAFCGAAWLMASAVTSGWRASFLALAQCIIGYVWMDWSRPLTDPFLVVFVVATLASYYRASIQTSAVWFCTAALFCGIGIGFRSELALLAALIISGGIWITYRRRGVTKALKIGAMLLAIIISLSAMPAISFLALTGQDMPPQLTSYLLGFRTVEDFGDRSLGPASMELYERGIPIAEALPGFENINPMRLGLSGAYTFKGAAYANQLFRKATVETIFAKPEEVGRGTASALLEYLVQYKGISRLDLRSDSEELATARQLLTSIDIMRSQQSADRFGGDYHRDVAPILTNRLSFGLWLDHLPSFTVKFTTPSWIVLMAALISLIVEWRRSGPMNVVTVALLFYVGVCLAASFSQGFVLRYWLSASVCLVIVTLSVFFSMISKSNFSNAQKLTFATYRLVLSALRK